MSPRRPRTLVLSVWTALLGSLVVLGCESGDGPQASKNAPQDESPAFARQAREAHLLADRAQDVPKQLEAARRLEQAYAAAPADAQAIELREDMAARAARLYLSSGEVEDARRLARKALSVSEAATVTRANLFVVLADAEQASGHADLARSLLLDALSVNQELLEKELENP